MRAVVYSDIKDIPARYGRLCAEAAGQSFYSSLPWYRNLIETTAVPGERLVLIGVEADKDARALLVARSLPEDPQILRSYTTPYTTLFGPILRNTSSGDEVRAVAGVMAEALVTARPRWQAVHLDAMDDDTLFYGDFAEAMAAAGFAVQRYFHFGNQFEAIAAPSFDAFLRKRPSQLRNTLKRKGKKLDTQDGVEYRLVTGEEGLEDAIQDYEAVYAKSWKEPEPYPKFAAGLARAAADAGALRLGVMTVDGTPAAAQIWLVSGGGATIFKLAYDEAYKALSLGSLLSRTMMAHVIEVDGVSEVDFGRGDDPYKAQWMAARRERWGIAAYNPRTVVGLVGACRHVWARAITKRLGAGR